MKKDSTPNQGGLTVAAYAAAKKLDPIFLEKVGFSDCKLAGRDAIRIYYADTDSEPCAVRYRLSLLGDKRFSWRKGSSPCLYGLWRRKALKAFDFVILPEGESDAVTLWSQGFPALGIPGAAMWREEWAADLVNYKKIFLVVEPDKGGETLVRLISTSSVKDRVYIIQLKGAKDPSELYMQDPDGFRATFQKVLNESHPLSELLPSPKSGAGRSKKSHASDLVQLVPVEDLFYADEKPYATIRVNGHKAHHPINSNRFRQWMGRSFYESHGTVPSTKAISEATNTLSGKARFEGVQTSIYTRVAEHDGKIYVDLADANWRVAEISGKEWSIVTDPPVRFRRSGGMLALPDPVPGGNVKEIKNFINFATNDDRLLALAWLISALRPRGPYPILGMHGEQGSGKSTAARVLRALVDPNTASVRSAPRDVRDLMISATNSHVISLDNVSHIPQWLSDALCRLATGGGLATRQLYTDDEEIIFDAMRPILINGIGEVTARGDLMERTILTYLPTIEGGIREPESELWKRFKRAHPRILGALFSAVSTALREYPNVTLESLPRMADFATWATAAETSLGAKGGAFMKAYTGNQARANEVVLESSPLAILIAKIAREERDSWNGTASSLLKKLSLMRGEEESRDGWPKSANALSGQLRRLAPNLRAVGIDVDFHRGSGKRFIHISLRT